MYSPWQKMMGSPIFSPVLFPGAMSLPMFGMPLMRNAAGGFPVPQAIEARQLPPAVKESIMRVLEGPPKPAVTAVVMNEAQQSMIGPDLPFKADV